MAVLGRRSLVMIVVAAVLTVAAASCGGSGAESADRLALGRTHYLERCSRCHQGNGQGYAQIYPNLARNPIVRNTDPDPVIEIVTRGRGSMPAFAQLPPDQLAEIITYIRHAWGNGAGSVTPSQVK